MDISGPFARFFVEKVNWRLFGLFAFVIISALVYVSFSFFGENILPGEGARTARNFIVETSKLFISAVVAGVVLKILVLERYFTDALSEVIHGMRGLKEMSPQRRIELWQTLTSWIYAPILHEGTALSPELQTLSQRMTKVIGRTFEYHKNFYLSYSDRQLEFEWTNEEDPRLRMVDFMSVKVVPFESSSAVPWQTERTSEKHLTLNDYDVVDTEFNTRARAGSGEIVPIMPEIEKQTSDDGKSRPLTTGNGSVRPFSSKVTRNT